MTTYAIPGPTVGLVALPDPDDVEPRDPDTVRSYLVETQAARQRQLDALPSVDLDPVAAAYRGTVERILAEVRAALLRVEAGLYGICTACSGAIPTERLHLRPWATACAACVVPG